MHPTREGKVKFHRSVVLCGGGCSN